MKASRKLLLCAAALLAAAALAAGPAAAQCDFSRLVIIGDSEGAGFQNNCLAQHGQVDSFGAILAREVGADFQQPIISEPGIGGCLVLTSLAPTFSTKPSTGQPTNLSLARPYNNLSVGGCDIHSMLVATTGSEARAGTCRSTIDLVLRNSALHAGSMVDQAIALNPTYVILENVGNEYLGAVLAGTVIDGVTVTPVASLQADYKAALAKLKAKQPNGLVFGVANVAAIPFVTTIPPVVTSGGAPVIVNGSTIPLLGPRDPSDPTKPCPGGAPACPVPSGTLVTLLAAQLMPLGYGIPCAVAPTLPKCNNPLPDTADPTTGIPGVLLYPNEVSLLNSRFTAYNTAIQTETAAAGYRFFDTNAFFTRAKAGISFAGMTVSSSFLSGGMFSYDGVHLTSIGYAILADEIVKFLRQSFPTCNLPEPDLSEFFFNGNTTGVMAPPLPYLRPDEVMDAAAKIFTPDVQRDLLNFIGPVAPQEIKVGNSDEIQPRDHKGIEDISN